jgi:hypothetical protein
MKPSFLKWLSTRSGQRAEEISTGLGNSLEALFKELEEEYGRVAPKDLDPRYMPHFLLK